MCNNFYQLGVQSRSLSESYLLDQFFSTLRLRGFSMNYGKFLFPFLIASSLTGCVVPQQSSDRISIAAVQKDIKVGMSSEEVVAILGAPNLVTTDDQRRESWVYDKVSTDTVYANGSGGAGVLGAATGVPLLGALGLSGSAGRTSTNQRTLTIIIKFDNDHKVRDYSYRQSSF